MKPGHADASTDGQGLLVLGQAAADYFGRTDLSTLDLDDDNDFQQWLVGLERAVPPAPRSPLARLLRDRRNSTPSGPPRPRPGRSSGPPAATR